MSNRFRSFTTLSLMAALALGAASVAWVAPDDSALLPARAEKPVVDAAAVAPLKAISNGVAAIAEAAGPSVVFIEARGGVAVPSRRNAPQQLPEGFEEFFRRFGEEFEFPQPDAEPFRRSRRDGSGFIVNAEKGYVLTNNHVVGGADRVSVRLADQRVVDAKLLGADPATDVALLQIDAKNLTAAAIGDEAALRVGDMVVAIGSPFGLTQSVTTGIVSGIGRAYGLADYEYSIQTDAAINPGNSGGPLFNLDGEVIGINMAIATGGSRGNDGVGFAIPISLAVGVAEQLLANGKVERGAIGVVIQPVTADIAESLGLEKATGALVAELQPNMPAAEAGLLEGDVIVSVDGNAVADVPSLRNRVSLTPIDDTVTLEIIRDGKKESVAVKVARLPGQDPEEEEEPSAPVTKGAESSFDDLGLRLQDLTPRLAKNLGFDGVRGALVAEVEEDSLAAEAGLREEMVIVRVGKEPIDGVKSFERELKKHAGKDSVLLLVRQAEAQTFVALPLKK